MFKTKSQTIAYLGVMSALIFVMLTLETYVFIYFIKPSPAFFSIPMAISLCLIGDKKNMFVGGTILGVCSFILSFIVGYPAFNNPLISLLPRIFIGTVSYYVYNRLTPLFSHSRNGIIKKYLAGSLAGAVGVVTNTILVMTMLYVFDYSGIKDILLTIMTFNFLLELISAIILVPIFTNTIKKILKVSV